MCGERNKSKVTRCRFFSENMDPMDKDQFQKQYKLLSSEPWLSLSCKPITVRQSHCATTKQKRKVGKVLRHKNVFMQKISKSTFQDFVQIRTQLIPWDVRFSFDLGNTFSNCFKRDLWISILFPKHPSNKLIFDEDWAKAMSNYENAILDNLRIMKTENWKWRRLNVATDSLNTSRHFLMNSYFGDWSFSRKSSCPAKM